MDAVFSATAVTLVERLGWQRSIEPIRSLVSVLSPGQGVSSNWIHFCSRLKGQDHSMVQSRPSTAVLCPA
jgi:hypothetical protein